MSAVRRIKAAPNGTRRPGCVVRGCPNQPREGALICDIHARALGGSIEEEGK